MHVGPELAGSGVALGQNRHRGVVSADASVAKTWLRISSTSAIRVAAAACPLLRVRTLVRREAHCAALRLRQPNCSISFID